MNNNDSNVVNLNKITITDVDDNENEREEIDARRMRQIMMLQQAESVDFTGCYHWCEERKLEECILVIFS